MKKLFSLIDSIVDYAGIIIVCAMIVIAFTQVFFRYILSDALSWTEESSLMLFTWMSYLGMVLAMKRNTHLRVDAFISAMPNSYQRALNLLCLAVAVLFCLVVAWLSLDTTMKIQSRGQTAVSFDFPMWYIWCGIPLCFTLTALQAARRFYLVLCGEAKED